MASAAVLEYFGSLPEAAPYPCAAASAYAFFALADPTRRDILARLAGGEATVTELAEPFGLAQPTISKHLRVLEEAGLDPCQDGELLIKRSISTSGANKQFVNCSPVTIQVLKSLGTLQRGESDAQIIDYMTARYGDFVLYRPPLKATTAFLWFGPALLLVGGVIVLVVVLRRRSRLPADSFEPDELDEADGPPAARDDALKG